LQFDEKSITTRIHDRLDRAEGIVENQVAPIIMVMRTRL
jgi:isopentenyldiphosphate isomerase